MLRVGLRKPCDFIHRCSCCSQDYYGLVPSKTGKLIYSRPCGFHKNCLGCIGNHICCIIRREISFCWGIAEDWAFNFVQLMTWGIIFRLAPGFIHSQPCFSSSTHVLLMSEVSWYDPIMILCLFLHFGVNPAAPFSVENVLGNHFYSRSVNTSFNMQIN